ncbi:wiskott-Aldrich syndrome protein homolog 1-like [Corvus kubaryi]|uniref:wiskott-Aldrich syndrome protein homolog 1-like n=1 Tax=Corvus kubaryi TaxID=68294 RepID=UPI001C054EE5|nr:wiskott-Aldrich syndrome protein homolog 1-like [Corvus kubaryi]
MVAPSRSTFPKVTSTAEFLAGPCLMTASAAARFALRCSPPTFPGGAPRGGGPGPRLRSEWALPQGAVAGSPPRGDARSGAGAGSRLAPPRAAASARPRRPPPSLPRCQSQPPARVAAGHGAACGVSLRWLLWCRGTTAASHAASVHSSVRPSIHPSVHPSIHPSIHPCVGGGSCVCVTDSEARTARGQPLARCPPGHAGAPRLRQPLLHPPEPSPVGTTSAVSLLVLLLPPGGASFPDSGGNTLSRVCKAARSLESLGRFCHCTHKEHCRLKKTLLSFCIFPVLVHLCCRKPITQSKNIYTYL